MERFIDVSMVDNHYFADNTGKTWIPIGCNVCFVRNRANYTDPTPEESTYSTYREWLSDFAKAGGNFIRIWLGMPFFDVQPRQLGEYDEQNTSHIRFIIKTCEELGIKIKFTFEHFRRIFHIADSEPGCGTLFDKPIYEGLASDMHEYMASAECRKIYLDRARYFAAQGFGDSPAVIAWELWNEINCTSTMEDVAEWSDYMIAELQKIFPRQMILQNIGSFSGSHAYKLYDYLAGVKDNGFLQVHRYIDPGAEIEVCSKGPMDVLCFDAIREMRDRNPNIPTVLAETGAVEANHSRSSLMYAIDKEGTLLHDAIFAPFFSGSAGCGQFWHWDEYIAFHNLWWHFSRFAEAIKGLDPAAEHFRPFHTSTPRTRVYGLVGTKTIVFWVRDKASSWQSELKEGRAAEVISGEMLISVYGENQTCDCYLPWEDRHVSVQLTDGVCPFPDFKRSLVVRFTR